MIILGIDPGTRFTGIGVIEKTPRNVQLLSADVIAVSPVDAMPQRLKKIFESLSAAIQQFHPDEIAIETMYYGKNAQSAMKLGQARGIAILSSVLNDIPITEYSPREVKKSVVGYGAATKQQVQMMVKSLLKMKTTPKHFDVTDALAVALCHSYMRTVFLSTHITHDATRYKNWRAFLDAHPEKISCAM
jgi:crossover junction endodeoxyribonuclease RuvC